MFNYYRFIRCRFSTVEKILREQAAKEQLAFKVIESFDLEDSDPNRVTIIVNNDVIVDIYRG